MQNQTYRMDGRRTGMYGARPSSGSGLSSRPSSPCPCGIRKEPVDTMVPAMAYVPWQQWDETFDAEKGFSCGTIFPELYKPFKGGMCR